MSFQFRPNDKVIIQLFCNDDFIKLFLDAAFTAALHSQVTTFPISMTSPLKLIMQLYYFAMMILFKLSLDAAVLHSQATINIFLWEGISITDLSLKVNYATLLFCNDDFI